MNTYTADDRALREGTHPAHSRAYALAGLADALVVAAREQGATRPEWTRVLVSGVLKFNRTHAAQRPPIDWLLAANNAYDADPTAFDLDRDLLSRQLNVIDPPQATPPDPEQVRTHAAVCHRFLVELAQGPMGYAETRRFYTGFE